MTNFEARDARIHRLRMNTQDRVLARWERDERKAAPMIGELSSGKYYVWPVGGRYFESASHTACVENLRKQGCL